MALARLDRKRLADSSPILLVLVFVLILLPIIVACRTNQGNAASVEGRPLRVDVEGQFTLLFQNQLHLEASITFGGEQAERLVLSWEQLTGPGIATFTPPNASATTIDFTQPGLYGLRFRATDGPYTAYNDVHVQVVAPEATYFVSLQGSNRNDGRTLETPFRTIARAARAVSPGDVVMLRGGAYHEYNLSDAWVVSGEPDKPITFMSYPGEIAVIDGSEATRSPNASNPSAPELIRLLDRDWYVFDNLVFRNSIGRGLSLEGNHNVARNVTSNSNHGDGIYIRGNYNLVENSLVYDNFSRSNGGDSADGIKVDSGLGNVIRNVVSYSNSDDGFDLWASHATLIEYSIAHHNGRGSTGNGNGFKLSSGGSDSDTVVRFNVSHSNRSHNFTDNGGGGLLVYNNTSWAAGAFGFVFRGRDGREVSELINNISFQDSDGVLLDIQSRGGQAPISLTNTWDLGISDPRFVTTELADSGFLKLSEGSPAIDAGTDVGVEFVGLAMDLGAFEFSTDY